MKKVLFICHGNICRSPMAEYILKDIVKRLNLTNEFIIKSAAVSTEEIGNPIYPKALKQLNSHQIYDVHHVAKKVTIDDYETFDYIFVMDDYNLTYVPVRFQNKVKKLGFYNLNNLDIADPWYNGRFEQTYDEIYSSIIKFLEKEFNISA